MEHFSNIHYYRARRNLVLDLLESHENSVPLQQLKKEYKEKNATDIPFSDVSDNAIHEWLSKIDSIGTELKNKEVCYFIQKPIAEVSSTVLKESKRKTSSPLVSQTVKRSRSAPGNDEPSTPTNPRQARSVRFKDQPTKPSKSRSKSEHRSQNKIMGAANMFGSLLIGDDFFLGVAIYKLGFCASKEGGRLQSGCCMSGMTIKDAVYKVKEIEDDRHKTAIIYIGSIDIAVGRELIEMMDDMTLLMQACAEKNIKPVLCTLIAMPNYLLGNRKDTLRCFNTFITKNPFGIPSIDINRCFKHDKTDEFNPHYFLEVPRYVSGFKKPLVLWSRDGRDRVHDMLMKNLGMALVAVGNISHNYI